MRLLISVLISIFMGNFLLAAGPAADLDARRKALNDLLDEHWEYRLRESPIFASFVGDKRYNDKVDDFSQEAIDAHLEQQRRFLTRFEAIDTTGFPDQEVLNKRLIVRDLKMELDEARFKHLGDARRSAERPSHRVAAIDQHSAFRHSERL
jgi:uncharacterized protein (DUF885 family)